MHRPMDNKEFKLRIIELWMKKNIGAFQEVVDSVIYKFFEYFVFII